MHAADASTPEPTYGTSRHSSSPCTVPSSPNGPCRTGNTTSAPSSPPPGVSATGAPSHDQRPSRATSTATTSWPAALQPRPHRRGRGAARRRARRSGRRRAPRRDAASCRRRPPGVVGVVGRRSASASGARRRSAPARRPSPACRTVGVWSSTIPSSLGSVVSRKEVRGSRPAAVSVSLASCAPCPSRSGTTTVGIALATTIATVEPGAAFVPADGRLAQHGPRIGAVGLLFGRRELEALVAERLLRLLLREADDVGHRHLLRAATRRRASRSSRGPPTSRPPATCGSRAPPTPCRRPGARRGRRRGRRRSAWPTPCSPRARRRTGTGTCPGPLDTVSVTVEPSFACSPPPGSCASTSSTALLLVTRSTLVFKPGRAQLGRRRRDVLARRRAAPSRRPAASAARSPTTTAAIASAPSSHTHHGGRRRSSGSSSACSSV